MRLILLACLAACTDPNSSRDAHNLTSCDVAWDAHTGGTNTACEAACVAPATMTGAYCKGTSVQGRTIDCSMTFEYDGLAGCCIPYPLGGDAYEVRFFVCD